MPMNNKMNGGMGGFPQQSNGDIQSLIQQAMQARRQQHMMPDGTMMAGPPMGRPQMTRPGFPSGPPMQQPGMMVRPGFASGPPQSRPGIMPGSPQMTRPGFNSGPMDQYFQSLMMR